MTLIEGHNPLGARRTGARELLRQGWPGTAQRLAAVLRGSDPAARIAVASALARMPQYLDPLYVEPLLAMLAAEQPELRAAAGHALSSYRDGGVAARLRALIFDGRQPLRSRVAAVQTLGLMTSRAAIGTLVDALGEPGSPLRKPALAALELATALDFAGDVEAARRWWAATRDMPLAEWQRIQVERLVAQNRAQREQRRALQNRLARALRDAYLRTAEAERPATLSAYLNDPLPVVRLLGLELLQTHLSEGKTLPEQTAADARELLADPAPKVRAAAVGAVSSFRDPADAQRFEQLLASERFEPVRRALVNGLGYVGSASSCRALLRLLDQPHSGCAGEAVTALGRLAERGVLDAPLRRDVAGALLARYRATQPQRSAARERLLWALSRMADPQAGPVFVAALDPAETVAVRQAAVQGIAVLSQQGGPAADQTAPRPASGPAAQPGAPLARQALIDALIPATRDADTGVRRAAVETLAGRATSDAHLNALWERLSPAQEPDEAIRELAWRGVLGVLARRPAGEPQRWIARLPENGSLRTRRALELLQLAEKALADQPAARGRLGHVRAQIAARRAALGQPDDALASYLAALQDLHAARAEELPQVALELLRLALLEGRYDRQVADALSAVNPPLDGRALWEGLRADIERLIDGASAARAVRALAALRDHPPASMPAEVGRQIQELLQRARAAQSAPAASQPATAPGR